MKPIAMILIVLLMMGCKTKRISNSLEIQKEFEKIALKKDSIKNESKSQEKEVISEKKSTDQKKESNTEIDIVGKAENDQPLELYQIENGDTLQSIKVVGKAEVRIRAKASNSIINKNQSSSESIVEKFKEFSENIVQQNNVKERVQEVKKKSKESITRTGTFWSFGLLAGLGCVALILVAAIIYFKK